MSTCRSCRARITWAVTERGKRMPVDADPVPRGNLVLIETDGSGLIASVVDPDALLIGDPPRYVSHFSTCPNADQHRKDTHA